MSAIGNTWFSFECLKCGAVFDVRTNDLRWAKCPVCSELCEFRAQWEADFGGYGSHGDAGRALAFKADAERRCGFSGCEKPHLLGNKWCDDHTSEHAYERARAGGRMKTKTKRPPSMWFGLCYRCNRQLHARGHALVVEAGHVRKIHHGCLAKGEAHEKSAGTP
jgi:hypothetical protein